MDVMINSFGFRSHHALGDAGAELAEFDKRAIVDGGIRNGNDVFIYGARTFIKIPHPEPTTQTTMIITAAGMAVSADVFMDLGARFLFAILSSGDFDPGLPNIRPDVVCALAQSGIGSLLYYVAQNLGPAEFDAFLWEWRALLNASPP